MNRNENRRWAGRAFSWLIPASLLLLAMAPIYAQASQQTSFSFNLIGPNLSKATATVSGTPVMKDDTLRLTGSGTFDTSTHAVRGGGSVTHFRPDGTVFARGTWVLTGFVSFNSYGGPRPGTQGGVLMAKVTIIGPEATFTGITLQVSCKVKAPANAPDEGATLPDLFPERVSGLTLFHIAA